MDGLLPEECVDGFRGFDRIFIGQDCFVAGFMLGVMGWLLREECAGGFRGFDRILIGQD